MSTWNVYAEVTEAFGELVRMADAISDKLMKMIDHLGVCIAGQVTSVRH